jgi:hypothetical protein
MEDDHQTQIYRALVNFNAKFLKFLVFFYDYIFDDDKIVSNEKRG